MDTNHPPAPPRPTLLRAAWRLIRIVFAFTIIVIAALLGLVPGIPGWPLGLLGLTILAAEFVWARRLLARVKSGTARLRHAATWKRRQRNRE